MSTLSRTFRNIRQIGLKEYWRQINRTIGDTKAGTLIGTDRFGNKYFENLKELPLRTRWVDYKEHFCSPCQIEPGWHAWMSYLVDKPPTEDPLIKTAQRVWELPEHRQNLTASRGAYKPYCTVKPKIDAWIPEIKPREVART